MASNPSFAATYQNQPAPGKLGKVLFVDDELDQCRLVSEYLRMHAFEVSLADNAQLALYKAGRSQYSIIILDVNLADLTGGDGSNLLAAMKKLHPNTPIVLYTGMSEHDAEVSEMLKHGALRHISKGDTLDTLLKAVQETVQQN